ncbi:hypothetical protein A2U01_0067142, partial [Trifolium medium]|nr:hypothetical protein [Trifolium medium]
MVAEQAAGGDRSYELQMRRIE